MKPAKTTNALRIYTTYDIGRMTGTDPTTVHKWIDKGLLRGYRTPGGHRRVRAEDLRSFLIAHRIPIPKELGGTDSLRVMVVDDDGESLKALSKAVKKLRPSWELASLNSGVEALLQIPSATPDVIVLSLSLGDADGLSICRHLQTRPETSNIKVLAACEKLSAELAKTAASAGAHGCVKKPLSGAEAVEAIELAAGIRPHPPV
ncbi:MAG: response regulator [Myxococcales bacterium]